MKVLIEIDMDGYDTKEDHEAACLLFLDDLNASAITVRILRKVEDGEL